MPFRFDGNEDELQAELAHLTNALAGRDPDHTGAARRLKHVMGRALLGKIQDAFEKKSGGGTDDMGVKWEPLAASTLALRHIVATPGRVSRLRGQQLTSAQRALVRTQARRLAGVVYHANKGAVKSAIGILERKHRAGSISDSYYHSKKKLLTSFLTPQKAALTVAAGAYAQILRDTGRLYRSLRPDLDGHGDQVIHDGVGWLEVGTSVPYSIYHDSPDQRQLKKDGSPKLPRRQIFPEGGQVPDAWQQAMVDAALREMHRPDFWRQLLGPRFLG